MNFFFLLQSFAKCSQSFILLYMLFKMQLASSNSTRFLMKHYENLKCILKTSLDYFALDLHSISL